jgi:hypothetical protein
MNQVQPLTITEANELGGAMHDLAQLNTKSIIEKDDAARKRTLANFISTKMLEHSQELLARWFTVEMEYKPFLRSAAAIFGNVFNILQSQQPHAQEEAKPASTTEPAPEPPQKTEEAPIPSNVETLVQPS